MKVDHCEFVCAALRPEEEPSIAGPLVLFFGRSNVGKSSLINRLLGTPGLARTSSTPGRTRDIHFYSVNGRVHFVDLPGYGWAKVSRSERESWGPKIEEFLDRRLRDTAVALSLVDSRIEPTELDRVLWSWLEKRGMPWILVATKADKLSGNERARRSDELGAEPASGSRLGAPLLVSSSTGDGIRAVWAHLDGALAGFASRTRGVGWTSEN